MPAVGIPEVAAESGDYDFLGILVQQDDAKVRADIEAVREKLQNLGGGRAGGDVIIGGVAAEEKITHAAPNQQGLVALALQRVADRIGELPWIHGMIMRQKAEPKNKERVRKSG